MEEFCLENVDQVMQILLYVLGMVVLKYLIPWLKKQVLYQEIMRCVQAAEKLLGSSTGSEKKEYVIQQLQKKNRKVSPEMEVLIEAAVMELDAMLGKNRSAGE